jgi:hypothetical protein
MFSTRAFQIDVARQPESLDTLQRVVADGARFGFNQCHLYLENKLRLDTFGSAAAGLSKDQMRDLIEFAAEREIEIVPSLNLLGHTEHSVRHEEFADLRENREGARRPDQDHDGCLCPSLDRTRSWAREVIEETAALFPSENFHVGLDETWPLGSCPLCRVRESEEGLGALFAGYANFLNDQVSDCGKTMWMWADMLFYFDGSLQRLDRDIVLVDWFYRPVENTPLQSFFNWRRVDTTRRLLEAGHRVVPAGGLGSENLRSFTRYAEGLGVREFLVTQWEGSDRFQDNYAIQRCRAGHLLTTGRMPDSAELGRRLLPDHGPQEQRLFVLASQAPACEADAALSILDGQEDSRLHRVTRSRLLQRSIVRAREVAERELHPICRDVLRGSGEESAALNRELRRLRRAARRCTEWQDLLAILAEEHGEERSARGIYGNADALCAAVEELRETVETFAADPAPETYPFAPAELVLEFIILDPCAHRCRALISDDGKAWEEVLSGGVPTGDRKATLRAGLEEAPRFARVEVGGYARIGLANVRCETLAGTHTPRGLVEAAGNVVDPQHILRWDETCALLNEPDVESKWRVRGETPANYVVVAF